MKPIHLKNLKSECVLVELPDRSTNIQLLRGNELIFDEPNGYWPYRFEFKVSMIGRFTDLKEEDFEGIVHTDEIYDPVRFPWGEGIVYKNYNANTWGWYATPSFISSIEAEGWYVNGNPYEKTCNKNMGDALSYIQAQEKVINLSNCYLFVKS